ncbi:hypothetical protein [Exiguobacterium sp. s80]|uniref:hypothetical protein n=1 Tax=Exiguobacterium sp. s80 TaxID=2751209 RepID=UPI001BE7E238|nr:hypothetical protein [Exiguobacterium sp. s80]
MRTLTSEQREYAKKLLDEAILYQIELEKDVFKNELIDRTTPVLWFGDVSERSWLTIATNPSAGQFLNRDGTLRYETTGPFVLREVDAPLTEYRTDQRFNQMIDSYNRYFKQPDIYKSWFGREGGGKLEGFLNGFEASFYGTGEPVIHTDFFPFPTKRYMGTIAQRHELEETVFGQTFLLKLIRLFSLRGIILLGREHTERYRTIDQTATWQAPEPVPGYPDAVFELGYSEQFSVPIIGLHFKPSEQFIGLGNRPDCHGVSHGTYGSAESLRKIGKYIRSRLEEGD